MSIAGSASAPVADLTRARPKSALAMGDVSTWRVFVPIGMALVYFTAVIRMAWLSDDAFITLRAVDNLTRGHGLVSNPPERVLAFTNPLLALVMAALRPAVRSGYATLMAPGLFFSSLAALWIALRLTRDTVVAAMALVLVTFSAAATEFSTSGLENPLAHLLLLLFGDQLLRPAPSKRRVWLLAGLVGLNRLDHLLIVLPASVSLYLPSDPLRRIAGRLKRLPRALGRLASHAGLGMVPLFAWLLFCIVYYGFPFPNTAYAKLNTQLAWGESVAQGIWYLVDSLNRDPLTLIVTVAVATVALLRRRRQEVALALGLVLYLCYVVRIGGDFMSGRFLTAPFFVAIALFARAIGPDLPTSARLGTMIVVLVLASANPGPFTREQRFECAPGLSGIVNERQCYAEHTALAKNIRAAQWTKHEYYRHGEALRAEARRVEVSMLVGMAGFAAGPGKHIIDPYALTDPLLARIPYHPGAGWRIGHFDRPLPAGYEATVTTGNNVIEDPCVARLYDDLASVTRGPLFRRDRWRAIWRLNVGGHSSRLAAGCPKGNAAAAR